MSTDTRSHYGDADVATDQAAAVGEAAEKCFRHITSRACFAIRDIIRTNFRQPAARAGNNCRAMLATHVGGARDVS